MADKNIPPCRCSHFIEFLNDPDSGITVNEDGIFSFDDPFVLYYCPRCKGRLPNLWNAHITDEERERLQDIIDSISTADEAIQRLGPPDYDSPMHVHESIGGRMVYNEELSSKCRNIEYYHLSECADLEFYFDKDYGVQGRIILKPTEE